MYYELNDVLSVEEVAELLCIGRNTAYALVNSGEIPAFRIGRMWKIPRVKLEEYVINKCSR